MAESEPNKSKVTFELDMGIGALLEGPDLFEPGTSPDINHCSFREETSYKLTLTSLPDSAIRVLAGGVDLTQDLDRVSDGAICHFNWRGYVGHSRLIIDVGGRAILDLPVEVKSRKVGYEDDYRSLLDELSDWVSAIVFSFQTPSTVPSLIRGPKRSTKYLQYLVLRKWMQRGGLPSAFRLIESHPHRRLDRLHTWVDISSLRSVTSRTIESMTEPRGNPAPGRRVVFTPAVGTMLKGRVPTEAVDTRTRIQFDTPENRFLLHGLNYLAATSAQLDEWFAQDLERSPGHPSVINEMSEDCRVWSKQLRRMSRASFLEGVGEMKVLPSSSQVLQRREGYRRVLSAFLNLQMSWDVEWNALAEMFEISAKDVPTLYEYWAFFSLADAVSRAYGESPELGTLVAVSEGLYEITLQEGKGSCIRIGPAKLYFNRRFSRPSGSYSIPLRPDFAIEVGAKWYLFDAKYRLEDQDVLEGSELGSESGSEVSHSSTYKDDDLYKMHTYKDALGATAVFTLYPGTTFAAFSVLGKVANYPAQIDQTFEGVGAIPLRPSFLEPLQRTVGRLLGVSR